MRQLAVVANNGAEARMLGCKTADPLFIARIPATEQHHLQIILEQ